MTFAQIPGNAAVFIDANIFIYYFTPDPALGPACQRLISSITRQDLIGYTSTHVLMDVAHRLMTLEAIARFGWPQAGIARRLRRHPAEVQQLQKYRQAFDEVPRLGIDVLAVSPHLLAVAGAVSQQTGLLTDDALIVAIMQDEAISHIASHDSDFDSVPGITRYSPV
jgi:predicted nucleic acid-binding protein